MRNWKHLVMFTPIYVQVILKNCESSNKLLHDHVHKYPNDSINLVTKIFKKLIMSLCSIIYYIHHISCNQLIQAQIIMYHLKVNYCIHDDCLTYLTSCCSQVYQCQVSCLSLSVQCHI